MARENLPAIQLYVGDWLKDDVSGCSLSAQGLWLRMMFIMHCSERYGYLQQNGKAILPESVARRCGSTLDQYLALLAELDTANVPSRTNDGIIYSRRMVRDAVARKANSDRQAKYRALHNGHSNARVTAMSHRSSSSSSSSASATPLPPEGEEGISEKKKRLRGSLGEKLSQLRGVQ